MSTDEIADGRSDCTPKSEKITAKSGERQIAVDRAKGLGIALVVWGHLATAATPGLPTWFYISVTAIYSFHMPLFMYLSGFVFFLSNSDKRFWDTPALYVWKRFDRLMIPCVIFAIVVILGKYFLMTNNPFGSINYFSDAIGSEFLQTLENTPGNPVLSIWYLIVLFIYSLITPFLTQFVPKAIYLLCFIGLVLWLFNFTEKYYIERIAQYFIFFAVGGLIAIHKDRILPLLSAYYIPAFIVFASLCYLTLGNDLALLIVGLASLPAFHGLFLQAFWRKDKLFLFLGKNSMAIYLINTIVIGLGQILYTRYFPYTEGWFFVYSPILFLFGLLVPIAVRYALSINSRLQPVRRYID